MFLSFLSCMVIYCIFGLTITSMEWTYTTCFPPLWSTHVSPPTTYNIYSLTKEVVESQKQLKDGSVESEKKTMLNLQVPKMEAEIKALKATLAELLEEQELDPRGEYYVLAQKLIK
jgi:hypothetical protein